MKYLYKYPQCKFPYEKLVEENSKRSKAEQEYTLFDAGAFALVLLQWRIAVIPGLY